MSKFQRLDQLLQILDSPDDDTQPESRPLGLVVGQAVFIRTVTYHYVGRVAWVNDGAVSLRDASWVATSGRFGACQREGAIAESERYPAGVTIALQSIVDWSVWNHPLPDKDNE